MLSHVSGGSKCCCRTQIWWGGLHCSSDWVSAGQSGTNTWMQKSNQNPFSVLDSKLYSPHHSMFLIHYLTVYFTYTISPLSWSFSSSSPRWLSRCCCVVLFSLPANLVRVQLMENWESTWSQCWTWLISYCVCLGLFPCVVSGELPLVSSAEGNKRSALLEKFLVLWSQTPSPPLHLLLSEPTLTAIFSATDSEVKPLIKPWWFCCSLLVI